MSRYRRDTAELETYTIISDATHAILENSTFDDLTITRENTTLRLLDEEIKEKNESNISQRLCTLGFLFDSTIFKCVSECRDFQTKCKNKGRCVLNIDGNPECRCREDADFVFTGQYCDIKIEKLALESKYIIAIATSIGSILSAVIITTCLLYHIKIRKVKRTKTLEPADDEDNISQYRPSSVHRSMHASADLYSSDYKIYDDDFTEQKPVDLSSTMHTYKPWTTTECDNRFSPWYKSNDIISGKEFTIKRPKIILYRASMYDC
ncbi:uncharacterized protein [Mytilus edulis]|uniref:uncharacterized protein n=1 Tax=Mytilus edulis TaxID=6550 RepID=UPI0039F001DD